MSERDKTYIIIIIVGHLGLYKVPGLGDLAFLLVELHRVLHLLLERVDELLAEDVAQHTADQDYHEQQQYYYEVLTKETRANGSLLNRVPPKIDNENTHHEQHTLDFASGT